MSSLADKPSERGLQTCLVQQQKLYRIIARGSGVDVLTRHLQKSMAEKIEQRFAQDGRSYEIPTAIIATFLAGSFLSLITWWLENRTTYSPEQMDGMFQQLGLARLKQQAARP